MLLPAKYADFADVFDKRRADVLPEHTHHDLAIETEDNKVPPFSPTYDHSRLELEVLLRMLRSQTKPWLVRLPSIVSTLITHDQPL